MRQARDAAEPWLLILYLAVKQNSKSKWLTAPLASEHAHVDRRGSTIYGEKRRSFT